MLTNKGCKNKITQIRKGQKYHCRDCFLKLTIKLGACPEDNKKFKRKFTGQVCCSRKCANTYRAKNKIKGWEVPCTRCGKMVYKMPSRIHRENYCNKEHRVAYYKSKKSDKAISKNENKKREWTVEQREGARLRKLGKKNTLEQNLKIKLHSPHGKNNKMWKGEFASYPAMHMWVTRHNGKALNYPCDDYNFLGISCKGRMEWSNVDHKYKRNLNDYSPRCTRHHRIYDIIHGLVIPTGKQSSFFSMAKGIKITSFTMDAVIFNHNEMVEDVNRVVG